MERWCPLRTSKTRRRLCSPPPLRILSLLQFYEGVDQGFDRESPKNSKLPGPKTFKIFLNTYHGPIDQILIHALSQTRCLTTRRKYKNFRDYLGWVFSSIHVLWSLSPVVQLFGRGWHKLYPALKVGILLILDLHESETNTPRAHDQYLQRERKILWS